MKFNELPKNNKFCPMPWIGVMVSPDGIFKSCCVQSEKGIKDSDLKENTLHEVRNSKFWNELRQDLINGVEHKSCEACWKSESLGLTSLRHIRTKEFGHFLNNYDDITINSNGTLTNNNIYFWDIRDTNLCNMKCVMCGPKYSSLWNEEAIKYGTARIESINDSNGPVINFSDHTKDDILQIFEDNLENLESLYFAGGEPIISPMHWKILEILVKHEKFDVRLSYNTNLSKLSYKKNNIIDIWKKFKDVNISCSIDAITDRAEYVRFGTNWKTIDENFKILKSEIPDKTGINMTTSLMTIGGIPDIVNWLSQFTFNPYTIYGNNVINYPEFLTPSILPNDLKNKIWKDIKDPLNKFPGNSDARTHIEKNLFLNHYQEDLEVLHYSLIKFITKLDNIRNNNSSIACPELTSFFDELKTKFKIESK